MSLHKRVTELPVLNTLTGSEIFYCAQGGLDKAVLASILAAGSALDEPIVNLVDGATVSINVAQAKAFHLTALGNRTILAPVNAPVTGRTLRMILRHEASGANRTLTLTTGVAGGFRFGTTVTTLSATLAGTTDYIGFLWNQPALRWDVVAYAKGF